jgi:hypothetical protein
MSSSSSISPIPSTGPAPHKQGVFDLDDKAFLRLIVVLVALAVLIGIYVLAKILASVNLHYSPHSCVSENARIVLE